MAGKGWYGVDFDGTLAEYHGWNGGFFGKPIPAMVDKINTLLSQGFEVRILTARGDDPDACRKIQDYLVERCGLPRLKVTNQKDFAMIEIWDDRARRVAANLGIFEADALYHEIELLRQERDGLRREVKLLRTRLMEKGATNA